MPAMSTRDVSRPNFAFISLLRAVAALLVVWDHLVGCWIDIAGHGWIPLELVERYVNGPLGITEHFGFFGVALFFLISGFIITHVAQREDRLTFGLKRLLRIYPPLIASVLLLPWLYRLGVWLWGIPDIFHFIRIKDQIWSCTLLNYVNTKYAAVNQVAWTLAIEVMFYMLCCCLLPLIQRRPIPATILQFSVVGLLIGLNQSLGFHFHNLAQTGAYLPCLLLGQLVYFLYSGSMRFRDFAVFSLAGYCLFIQGQIELFPDRMQPGNTRGTSLAIAYGVFIVALLLTKQIRLPAFVRFTSEVSYSLYLWHAYIGLIVLFALHRRVPFEVALAVTLAAVFAISYLSWRFIESPSQMWARWLLERWRPTAHSIIPAKSASEAISPVRRAA